MFPQFTYNDLKKQYSRDEIIDENVSIIGTKSGNYGAFTEHFKALSSNGAESLKRELTYTAEMIGLDYDQFMESMPQLKELLK